MSIQYSQTPKEQFRDLIPTFRNKALVALMQPLCLLHQQLHSNGSLANRSGSDTSVRNMVLIHMARADRIRQRMTFKQANENLSALTLPEVEGALKAELEKITLELPLSEGPNPSGGDTVPPSTQQLVDVPWKFDGTDSSGFIRLISQLEPRFMGGPGYLVFQAVNEAIVGCTIIESRFEANFLSRFDSLRILGLFQQVVTVALQFMGEGNRLDVPEAVLANERPSGPASAPNVLNEVSGNSKPAGN